CCDCLALSGARGMRVRTRGCTSSPDRLCGAVGAAAARVGGGAEATAADTAPAAAMIVEANSFRVRCMKVLPFPSVASVSANDTDGTPAPEASLLLELLK
ncbi:hypothetical protein, partial [Mycolicibacterium vanbaalenii]|uniref:hypothetical protein n=1 Tax=Mycolicibacterium vanbaalenii TaxID=110539 RepID=UPI0021F3911D